MKRKFAFVSSSLAFVLGIGAVAGCGGTVRHHAPAGRAASDAGHEGRALDAANHDSAHAPRHKLRGAAVGNYNYGYVDGVGAAAFFNKGQPLTDQQVDRLIEIGRRQGDPTGLLALEGYADGYRTGAKHANNPYAGQMTPEQVAQVRKAQGLPPVADESEDDRKVDRENTVASARQAEKKQRKESRREDRKHRRDDGRENAEASAR